MVSLYVSAVRHPGYILYLFVAVGEWQERLVNEQPLHFKDVQPSHMMFIEQSC